ncbi:MAG: HAMP domain-containing protein [Defluviitaleaceae bacterium]|nr:HAMP domain-containing protein [Defluviitaleaceae bacterium]
MKNQLSLTIVILIIAALLFSSTFMIFMSYREKRSVILEQSAEKAMMVAQTIAAQIDPVRYEVIAVSGETDEYWYTVRDSLRSVAFYTNALYAFILLPGYTDVVTYFADTSTPLSDHAPFGLWDTLDVIYYAPEMFTAMNTAVAGTSGIIDGGDFGSTVAGFAPVLSGDGRLLGLVVIEFSVDDVLAPVNRFAVFMAIIALIFSAVFAMFAVIIVRTQVTKPLNSLMTASKEIAKGNMNMKIDKSRLPKNEIGTLAVDFASLVDMIRNLVADFETMTSEHLSGRYNFTLDETKYSGAYANLAEQMKAMTNYYVQNTVENINVMKQYSEGNFDYAVRPYEGDWQWANEAMSNL